MYENTIYYLISQNAKMLRCSSDQHDIHVPGSSQLTELTHEDPRVYGRLSPHTAHSSCPVSP